MWDGVRADNTHWKLAENLVGASVKARKDHDQLALFTEFVPHPAVDALKEVKLDSLSPLEAFDLLRKLKAMGST